MFFKTKDENKGNEINETNKNIELAPYEMEMKLMVKRLESGHVVLTEESEIELITLFTLDRKQSFDHYNLNGVVTHIDNIDSALYQHSDNFQWLLRTIAIGCTQKHEDRDYDRKIIKRYITAKTEEKKTSEEDQAINDIAAKVCQTEIFKKTIQDIRSDNLGNESVEQIANAIKEHLRSAKTVPTDITNQSSSD